MKRSTYQHNIRRILKRRMIVRYYVTKEETTAVTLDVGESSEKTAIRCATLEEELIKLQREMDGIRANRDSLRTEVRFVT